MESGLVRGSRARYIQPRGRWRRLGCAELATSDHLALPDGEVAQPTTPFAPNVLSPSRIHAPHPVAGSATSTRIADVRDRTRSNRVHHNWPVGGPPGGTETVYRIQTPRGSVGWTARRK
jgi:hypothetical protein